jgi:hypothetical protein
MRAEVVEVVRQLATEDRPRFRASYVAERAGVPVDVTRRDLVRLAAGGELTMSFELLCPDSGDTIAVFNERDQIPTTFASDECGDGDEFEVTTDLIWVTFTITDALRAEVARDTACAGAVNPPDPPGNRGGSRRRRAARASTTSRHTSLVPRLH